MKLTAIIFAVSCVCMVLGIVMHYWVLIRLDKADIPVKYFGSGFRSYKEYARAARERGWRYWPLYVIYSMYLGLLASTLMLALDRSLFERVMRSLK